MEYTHAGPLDEMSLCPPSPILRIILHIQGLSQVLGSLNPAKVSMPLFCTVSSSISSCNILQNNLHSVKIRRLSLLPAGLPLTQHVDLPIQHHCTAAVLGELHGPTLLPLVCLGVILEHAIAQAVGLVIWPVTL